MDQNNKGAKELRDKIFDDVGIDKNAVTLSAFTPQLMITLAKEVFIAIDSDDDGAVDLEELLETFLKIGFILTKQDHRVLFRVIDSNKSGAAQNFLSSAWVRRSFCSAFRV